MMGHGSLNVTPERPMHEENDQQEGGSSVQNPAAALHSADDGTFDFKLARNHTFKKRFDSVS